MKASTKVAAIVAGCATAGGLATVAVVAMGATPTTTASYDRAPSSHTAKTLRWNGSAAPGGTWGWWRGDMDSHGRMNDRSFRNDTVVVLTGSPRFRVADVRPGQSDPVWDWVPGRWTYTGHRHFSGGRWHYSGGHWRFVRGRWVKVGFLRSTDTNVVAVRLPSHHTKTVIVVIGNKFVTVTALPYDTVVIADNGALGVTQSWFLTSLLATPTVTPTPTSTTPTVAPTNQPTHF